MKTTKSQAIQAFTKLEKHNHNAATIKVLKAARLFVFGDGWKIKYESKGADGRMIYRGVQKISDDQICSILKLKK